MSKQEPMFCPDCKVSMTRTPWPVVLESPPIEVLPGYPPDVASALMAVYWCPDCMFVRLYRLPDH